MEKYMFYVFLKYFMETSSLIREEGGNIKIERKDGRGGEV